MRIAYLHYTPKKVDSTYFYYFGWGAALEGHEVIEKDCVLGSLKESDGEFDLCFVSPGFVEYKKHLYKKKSNTKYVLVIDEDMHQPVEGLKCVTEYYDYVFIHSEVNWMCLCQLGVRNVRHILPCYNPDIFFPVIDRKKFQVAFLGQFDRVFKIFEATRFQYCSDLEKDENFKTFIGKGFYAKQANEIYNHSIIALDLPIMSIVGARSLCIGATTAMLILPSTQKSILWMDSFKPEEDYIDFDGVANFKKTLMKWAEKPDQCLKISQNMNKKVRKHTYKERFKEILNITFDGNI